MAAKSDIRVHEVVEITARSDDALYDVICDRERRWLQGHFHARGTEDTLKAERCDLDKGGVKCWKMNAAIDRVLDRIWTPDTSGTPCTVARLCLVVSLMTPAVKLACPRTMDNCIHSYYSTSISLFYAKTMQCTLCVGENGLKHLLNTSSMVALERLYDVVPIVGE